MTYWNWTLDPVRDSLTYCAACRDSHGNNFAGTCAPESGRGQVVLEQEKRDLETEQKRLKVYRDHRRCSAQCSRFIGYPEHQ